MSNKISSRVIPFPVVAARQSRPALGILLIILGYGLLIGTIGLSYGAVLEKMKTSTFEGDFMSEFIENQLPFGIAFLLVFFTWRYITNYGMKLRQRDAIEFLQHDPRAPVLYLRSFDDDALADPGGSSKTVEQKFSKAFIKLAPTVSIGRPGEKLPELGTNRFYVSDDYWQKAIEYFLEEAQAVVILVGTTQGVRWEIEQALKTSRRSKLLFFFPHLLPQQDRTWWRRQIFTMNRLSSLGEKTFAKMETERMSRYQAFRSEFGQFFQGELPVSITGSHFLSVSSDNTTHLLSDRHPLIMRSRRDQQGLTLDYARTLRPFLEEVSSKKIEMGIIEVIFTNRSKLKIFNWFFGVLSVICFLSILPVLASFGWFWAIVLMLISVILLNLVYYGIWSLKRLQKDSS